MTELRVFEPRMVPIESIDSHLATVDENALTATGLQRRFAQNLQWTPEALVEPRFSQRTPTAASVLVPLVMRERIHVLFTTRTAHLATHSGQVAFPGGKAESQDADPVATALREAREEVGLEPQDVQVLGTFPIYTTGSGFLVTPVIGMVPPDIALVPNADEVADVFEVPLAFLMNPANHRHHRYEWEGTSRHWLSMEYHDGVTERYIWGVTAGLLRNLYRFLRA